MRPRRNSHCSYCGSAFEPGAPWPRTCAHCGQESFLNPIPVTVMVVPVHDLADGGRGVLAVRRDIEPGRGQWALPGGYVNAGETWQAAGVRELWEETGLRVNADGLRVLQVYSTPHDQVLIFAEAGPVAAADLPPFAPNPEVSEVAVLTAPQPLAFSSHSQVLADYLSRQPGSRAA